jgi:UDPglucose 6-dehydrogenase
MENFKSMVTNEITYSENQYDALEGADALAVVTEWSAFRSPDYNKIKSSMNAPVIFDGRNIYSVKDMEEMGFVYDSIGR